MEYSYKMESRKMHTILHFLDRFVEPRGLPNEDTPVRQFTMELKIALNTRDIPTSLRELWEHIQTETARGTWAEKELEHYSDSETYALHEITPIENHVEFIAGITQVFKQFGFSDASFKANDIRLVDIGGHLMPQFAKRMGYAKEVTVPAYQYQIVTNPRYTNTALASVNMDILVPRHPDNFKFKDTTPVALMIPRPAKKYNILEPSVHIYTSNEKLIRRILLAERGWNFKRYYKYPWLTDEHREYIAGDPYYDVRYKPLKVGDKCLVNIAENDFPPLNSDDMVSQ